MRSLIAFIIMTIKSPESALNETAFTVVKWNKLLGDFAPIVELASELSKEKERLLQSRRIETHNFNGQTLHMMYYEDSGFFHFHDNNTRISGITGDIWTVLSKLLNFTISVTNVKGGSLGVTFPNGTYGGILEYARLNKTDIIPQLTVYATRHAAVQFTPIFWTTSQRIFTSGQWQQNRLWMIYLFDDDVWYIILGFVLILSVVSKITQEMLVHWRDRNLQSQSYFTHLFHTFSTLCNQGNTQDNTGSGSRILSFTISIFAWLTLIGFSSRLVYSIAKEVSDAPFDDLNSLFEKTNLQVLALTGSASDIIFSSGYSMPIFRRIKTAKRYRAVSTLEKLYRAACFNSDKYVVFDSKESVAVRATAICRLLPVGLPYYVNPVAAGISRRVKYKKALDIGIMRLREYGLMDVFKKRYMERANRRARFRETESLAIDLDRVLFIFGVFCLGVLGSIVILAAENIVYLSNRRVKVGTIIEQFPVLKQSVPRCNELPIRNERL